MMFADTSKLELPKAILFDTDNTLYPYDPAHTAAMAATKEKVCKTLAIAPTTFDEAFKEARKQVKENLKGTASEHSRLLYMQKMLEIIGLGSQVMMALDFEQTYWRTFLANATLFDNVKELLEDIRLLGIPTAIVTDLTAQIQFRKIVYFGLDSYFDFIVTSEEAGFDKPHPAPFKIALQKMSITEPTVWMIGDNPENDIRGAKECINAFTLQKNHSGIIIGEGPSKPDLVFSEFSEIIRLLKKIQETKN